MPSWLVNLRGRPIRRRSAGLELLAELLLGSLPRDRGRRSAARIRPLPQRTFRRTAAASVLCGLGAFVVDLYWY